MKYRLRILFTCLLTLLAFSTYAATYTVKLILKNISGKTITIVGGDASGGDWNFNSCTADAVIAANGTCQLGYMGNLPSQPATLWMLKNNKNCVYAFHFTPMGFLLDNDTCGYLKLQAISMMVY